MEQKLIDINENASKEIIKLLKEGGYNNGKERIVVDSNEMIYVGDEEKDIIGANSLGIYSILINRTNNTIEYGQKKTN